MLTSVYHAPIPFNVYHTSNLPTLDFFGKIMWKVTKIWRLQLPYITSYILKEGRPRQKPWSAMVFSRRLLDAPRLINHPPLKFSSNHLTTHRPTNQPTPSTSSYLSRRVRRRKLSFHRAYRAFHLNFPPFRSGILATSAHSGRRSPGRLPAISIYSGENCSLCWWPRMSTRARERPTWLAAECKS